MLQPTNRLLRIFTVVFFIIQYSFGQEKYTSWDEYTEAFAKSYQKLYLADLQIAYINNLQYIQSNRNVAKQEKMFHHFQKELSHFDVSGLNIEDLLDYTLIKYEINLNLERIALEKHWLANKPKRIPETGIYSIPKGKEWYAYFLKRWIDASVTPDELYQFGLSEIERVKKAMNVIQEKSGMDKETFQKYIQNDDFFYTDVKAVQRAFEDFSKEIPKKLAPYFPMIQEIEEVKIKKGTNRTFVQVPAYYIGDQNTFFYNFFDTPFNKRQVAWIYMHEAVPGHHYQIQIEGKVKKSKIHQLFSYGGYREGWAAYVEELGNEFGIYETIYDELGKWEWDIIRSVRVAMDVGLNYYGWSDEKALEFWKQHIQGQDDIALREINRMKNWPAQVITYKYGTAQILAWKKQLEEKLDENEAFPWMKFHKKILEHGDLPFSVMDKLFFNTNQVDK